LIVDARHETVREVGEIRAMAVPVEAAWLRCHVHFLRNALDDLPRKADDDSLRELRRPWRGIDTHWLGQMTRPMGVYAPGRPGTLERVLPVFREPDTRV